MHIPCVVCFSRVVYAVRVVTRGARLARSWLGEGAAYVKHTKYYTVSSRDIY